MRVYVRVFFLLLLLLLIEAVVGLLVSTRRDLINFE